VDQLVGLVVFELTPSRAGSLPQFGMRSAVGASLLAKAPARTTQNSLVFF
jgi:hypothetical protein